MHGQRCPALILGVVPDAPPAGAGASQELDDSFEGPMESPSFYLLDEMQFFAFDDHPDGGDTWAQSDVLTAAYNLLDKTKAGLLRNKGKWMKDIFKGENLSLTDPRTPAFEIPPNTPDLSEEVENVRNLNNLFREGA